MKIICGKLKDNYGLAVKNETDFSVSLENNTLKLLFVVHDDSIVSKGTAYNDKLYEGDTVEIFLTLGEKNRYLELEVNPDGIKYAGIVTNNGSISIEYLGECPFEAITKSFSNGWQTEMFIPLNNLYPLGFDKKNAYFNLFRQDFQSEKLNLYALSPTLKPTFHDVESFLKLEL